MVPAPGVPLQGTRCCSRVGAGWRPLGLPVSRCQPAGHPSCSFVGLTLLAGLGGSPWPSTQSCEASLAVGAKGTQAGGAGHLHACSVPPSQAGSGRAVSPSVRGGAVPTWSPGVQPQTLFSELSPARLTEDQCHRDMAIPPLIPSPSKERIQSRHSL